jgi:hypothetical protein
MPSHAEQAMGEIVAAYDAGELKRKPGEEDVMRWSDEAVALLLTIKDLSVRGNLSMRAEKKARQEKCDAVEAKHIKPFPDTETSGQYRFWVYTINRSVQHQPTELRRVLRWHARCGCRRILRDSCWALKLSNIMV